MIPRLSAGFIFPSAPTRARSIRLQAGSSPRPAAPLANLPSGFQWQANQWHPAADGNGGHFECQALAPYRRAKRGGGMQNEGQYFLWIERFPRLAAQLEIRQETKDFETKLFLPDATRLNWLAQKYNLPLKFAYQPGGSHDLETYARSLRHGIFILATQGEYFFHDLLHAFGLFLMPAKILEMAPARVGLLFELQQTHLCHAAALKNCLETTLVTLDLQSGVLPHRFERHDFQTPIAVLRGNLLGHPASIDFWRLSNMQIARALAKDAGALNRWLAAHDQPRHHLQVSEGEYDVMAQQIDSIFRNGFRID